MLRNESTIREKWLLITEHRSHAMAIVQFRDEARQQSTGFNFSVEFCRNFGVFFVFASYREEKFRYFSPFFVFKFKNSKIFIKNSKKYDTKLGVLLSK